MTLYNLRSDGDEWRITKFDNDLNVESSYLVTNDECECPAGHRPSCRHRQMLPTMLAEGLADSLAFYDFDTRQVLVPQTFDEVVSEALPEGEQTFTDPQSSPGHTNLMISPEAIDEALAEQCTGITDPEPTINPSNPEFQRENAASEAEEKVLVVSDSNNPRSVEIPLDATVPDVTEYILDAVCTWRGSLRPPCSISEDDPGDPLWALDEKTVTVKPVMRKKRDVR